MSDHHDDPMIGKVIGKGYRIERLIGKGGMSYVYKAIDTNDDREVAVKVITLHRDRAKELEKRFYRETRIMQTLQGHENIISIYESGEIDRETYYLAMELIRGETLTQRIKRYKNTNSYMPFEEIIHVMRQVGAALDYMHGKKIIHRDLKPSNIMIEKGTERAVLMDFGLVMEDSENNSTMGTAFGTPRYIAPEQAISSQQAGPQSDQYSLGVIIYECLTNQTPFDEESAMSMALSHITNEPPDLRDFRPDLPEPVVKVVLKTLEKSPSDRYPNIKAFIDALEASMFGWVSETVVVSGDAEEDTQRPEPAQELPEDWHATPSQESLLTGEHPKLTSSTSTRKMPLYVGIGAVVLILGIALFAILGSNSNSRADNGAELHFFYNNTNLTIYNASGGRVDLTNYQLTTLDDAHTLDMSKFANPIIEDGECVVVSLEMNTPPLITNCARTFNERHTRKVIESYYWVWDSSINTSGRFSVVYRGRKVKSCNITDGECRAGG